MNQLKIIGLIVFYFISWTANAQISDEKLAIAYAQEGDCEKALVIFEDLFKSKVAGKIIYNDYKNCLEQKKDYTKLYQVAQYYFQKYKEYDYGVDYAFYLNLAGESKKSKKIYQSLIDDSYKDVFNSISLSNALRKQQQFDYALEVLNKNQDHINDNMRHAMLMAQLEFLKGNKENCFNILLDYTNLGDQNYQQVLSSLPAYLQEDNDYMLLKKMLLLRIRNSSFPVFYEEMLSWLFIQQKDWKSAFIHYKSISTKRNDQGRILLSLGETCMANMAYQDAAICYKYIMDLGTNGLYYNTATSGWLGARYKSVIETTYPDTANLKSLEKDYLVFINSNSNNPFIAIASKQLAEIYIKHLNKPKSAIKLLENVIKTASVDQKFKAQCKLDLGDAYLFDGDIWESELLYAQVEKSYKEEALGQEAKFRKAKLAYYRGEFSWAETQLEVLKGATSQLISNNAIELALHIQDNLGIDSNYIAMELYAQGELLLYQNKTEESLAKVNQIDLLFPTHSLVDEVTYFKAKIYAKQGKWNAAIENYKIIIEKHTNDILYDNALFELASIYDNQFNDTANAMLYFEKLILEEKGSLFVIAASARYRALRGDVIREEKNYFFEP